jgi:hypothetical protein
MGRGVRDKSSSSPTSFYYREATTAEIEALASTIHGLVVLNEIDSRTWMMLDDTARTQYNLLAFDLYEGYRKEGIWDFSADGYLYYALEKLPSHQRDRIERQLEKKLTEHVKALKLLRLQLPALQTATDLRKALHSQRTIL